MNTQKQPRMTRATKVLSLTAIAIFLVSLDTSIVVVAQRRIEEDLGHPTILTWVFSGYNIAYAAGLLTAGRFADVNGRKRSFLRGLALFSIGSILCGLAPSAILLVAARLVQAIGGAMLTPASLALVLPEFPAEKRTVAIGVWGAVGGLAAAQPGGPGSLHQKEMKKNKNNGRFRKLPRWSALEVGSDRKAASPSVGGCSWGLLTAV